MSVNLGNVPKHPLDVHKITLKEGVPKPPVLGIFVGKRGQGKTVTATRLLHYYTHHSPPVFQKELVFVISPTAESQQHLWDHIGVEEEHIYAVSTPTEIKAIVDDIIEILKSKKEKYDEDQEYLEAYDALIHDRQLTPRQQFLLDMRDCQPLDDPEPWPRPILLLDDVFDKLDEQRVKHLLRLLNTNDFGQIFLTDTDVNRVKRVVEEIDMPNTVFQVSNGNVQSVEF